MVMDLDPGVYESGGVSLGGGGCWVLGLLAGG